MGSKGLVVVLIVVFLESWLASAFGADLEQILSIVETDYSTEDWPLFEPSDPNLSSLNCSLIADFEQLQITDIPARCNPESAKPCSVSLDEFECQLRKRAEIMEEFGRQLEENWMHLSDEERIDHTFKLECFLRKQAEYLYRFQFSLKKIWCSLSYGEQEKFLDSYEDPLKRESQLLLKFEDFLHKQQLLPEDRRILLLQSFEDLTRQAVLLETFGDLLKFKCGNLEITKIASTCCANPGDTVHFTYYIINKGNETIRNVTVIDSLLGVIASGLSLSPHEMTILTASSVMKGACGTVCCNMAFALGDSSKGFAVCSCSKKVCVQVVCPAVKEDRFKVGLQSAMAVGSQRSRAQNVVKIEGDQGSKCLTCS